MSEEGENLSGFWAFAKGCAQLVDAFPILDTVFQLHQPNEFMDCDECSYGNETRKWPCATVATLLRTQGWKVYGS